ncbi:HK97 family phage prohead protease [Parabacteroides provencensis]|uniref:HK97 family phage prohead protease n=1 Tax=Parabacteroides provencensis TaxID=1944636 RepID=UPI000C161828|nr:HK97 family phage prohead protease [Parabacteroides provencensis]
MENQRIQPQEIEIRCLISDLHIEQREIGTASRTIAGYAAKFESLSEPIMGWFREKIARLAFEECDLSDVIMCFNHNVDDILARTISGTLNLSVDDIGLKFSFEAPNTTRGNDMLELIHRGDINKCSFKFIVQADEWLYADEKNGLEYDERTILKFSRLIDVALVVFPAYKDTEASVRHLEQRKTEFLQIGLPEQKETNRSATESQSRERLVQLLHRKII